jgi:hypothetical protein
VVSITRLIVCLGVATLLKIGCGFVGIRCYNHAAATTSRHNCRAEASARVASEVPCPTVHHQTKKHRGDNCTVLPCHREGNGKMAAR